MVVTIYEYTIENDLTKEREKEKRNTHTHKQTCDQEMAGLIDSRTVGARLRNDSGQVVRTLVSLSPSSIV